MIALALLVAQSWAQDLNCENFFRHRSGTWEIARAFELNGIRFGPRTSLRAGEYFIDGADLVAVIEKKCRHDQAALR